MLSVKNLIIAGISLGSLIAADTAMAQSLFTRDRNTSVLQRARPDYDPLGIRAGSFIIRPKLDLTLGFTDNAYAIADSISPDFGNQNDYFFIVRPSILAETDWGRHSISTGAYVEANQFGDLSDESNVNTGVRLDTRWDLFSNTALRFGGAYDLLNESRRVTLGGNLTDSPVEYKKGNIYGGIGQEFGRIRYRGRLDYTEYDYDDATSLIDGTPVDQDFRDREEVSVLFRTGFAVTKDSSLFLRTRYRQRNFLNASPFFDPADGAQLADLNRDSTGFTIDAGIEFDISRLARGSIAVGYLEEDFEDSRLEAIDGVSIDLGVEWFPTELTTVGVNAGSSVRASAFAQSAGFVRNETSLRVDHELLRNLIVSTSLGYALDDYQSISREDARITFALGSKFLINRILSASLDYTYEDQESSGNADAVTPFLKDYTSNTVMFTLSAER